MPWFAPPAPNDPSVPGGDRPTPLARYQAYFEGIRANSPLVFRDFWTEVTPPLRAHLRPIFNRELGLRSCAAAARRLPPPPPAPRDPDGDYPDASQERDKVAALVEADRYRAAAAAGRSGFITIEHVLNRLRERFEGEPDALMAWVPGDADPDDPETALWNAVRTAGRTVVRQVAARYREFNDVVAGLSVRWLGRNRWGLQFADQAEALGRTFERLGASYSRLFRESILGYEAFDTEAIETTIGNSLQHRGIEILRYNGADRRGVFLADRDGDLEDRPPARPRSEALGAALAAAVAAFPADERPFVERVILLRAESDHGRKKPRYPRVATAAAALGVAPEKVARVLVRLRASLRGQFRPPADHE